MFDFRIHRTINLLLMFFFRNEDFFVTNSLLINFSFIEKKAEGKKKDIKISISKV